MQMSVKPKRPCRAATLAPAVVFLLLSLAPAVEAQTCANPNRKTYNNRPEACAPEGTRGVGISVRGRGGSPVNVPDVRCKCLPIALRYNNPGVLKTPRGGWAGQMRDARGGLVFDSKQHAVFPTVEAGVAAWSVWMKRRSVDGNLRTAFKLMSLYAPPTDCVGSIGKPPNCPHGLNPTEEYARKIGASVGKGPHDTLDLDGTRRKGRDTLYAIFSAIITFEIGGDFCNGTCTADREVFERGMNLAWGALVD